MTKRAFVSGVGFVLLAWLAVACPLGRGNKQLGESCRSGNDCAGARCELGVCTSACKTDADCGSKVARMTCNVPPPSPENPEKYGVCRVGP